MNNASLILIIIGLGIIWYFLPKANNEPKIEEWKPEPISKQTNINDHIPLTGHCLVVGQTGSGKSNVLMSQTIRRIDSGHEIHIIDVKYELEALFEMSVKSVVHLEEAKDKFTELFELSQERQKLFRDTARKLRKPCRDVAEYKRLTGNQMNTVSLIVEELLVLIDAVGQDELTKLLVIGRSAEVFVVCAAQYITAKVLDRKASTQFTSRVFLGKYDRYAIPIMFGSIDDMETAMIQGHVGKPGKAAIQINSDDIIVRDMPRVTDSMLERYM